MRAKGKSLAYILDHSPYASTFEVVQAIKAHNAEMSLSTTETRQEQVRLEIERLDELQSEMWDILDEERYAYDKDGHELGTDLDAKFKAAKVILDCIKQRSALLQLTETDVSQAQAAVLIVGGKQGSYLNGLIGMVPEHSRPKDYQDDIVDADVID